ncbi:MAG TPA: VWA domain-containing protein [Pyrinomonadaceae bacterium]|nr:VWA domain-containing protein [Pyrinomonadaceae bacterium]
MLNPILFAAAVCALLIFGLVQSAAQESAPAPAAQVAPVKLEALITDDKGRFVGEVKPEQVRLSVNGAEQKANAVELATKPVTYGLVVDNSGSLRTQFGAVLLTAQSFLAENRPGDRAFVLRFVHRDGVDLLQGVTDDAAALRGAVERMRVEPGQTALIDALYLSAEHLLKESPPDPGRRRAIVLLSDGEERESRRKLEELLKLLRGTGVQLFCVGFVSELSHEQGLINKSRRDRATDLLKRLAAETGGLAFFPEKFPELQAAFGELVRHLRAQHEVAFTPAAVLRPEDVRKAELKVSSGADGRKRRALVRLPAPPAPAGKD